jgi:hypothetical protein
MPLVTTRNASATAGAHSWVLLAASAEVESSPLVVASRAGWPSTAFDRLAAGFAVLVCCFGASATTYAGRMQTCRERLPFDMTSAAMLSNYRKHTLLNSLGEGGAKTAKYATCETY